MGLGRRETRLLLKEFISELNELIRAKSSVRHKKAKQEAFEFGKKTERKLSTVEKRAKSSRRHKKAKQKSLWVWEEKRENSLRLIKKYKKLLRAMRLGTKTRRPKNRRLFLFAPIP